MASLLSITMSVGDVFKTTVLVLSAVCLLPVCVTILTWLATNVRYRHALSLTRSRKEKPVVPAVVPYMIPWLGSSLSFLDKRPGHWWAMFRQKYAPDRSINAILLGGIDTYVVASADSVQTLFKAAKAVSRDRFDETLVKNALAMSDEDYTKFYTTDHEPLNHSDKRKRVTMQETIYHDHLLATSAVNVLTSNFMRIFRRELSDDGVSDGKWHTISLGSWMKSKMFIASTTSLMGSRILELCPTLTEDYWVFDKGILSLFFGLPKFMTKEVTAALHNILDGMSIWHEEVAKADEPSSTEILEWHPLKGSSHIQARNRFYDQANLSMRGRASVDLGTLFGISSNAIPASMWMVYHILLSPTSIQSRLMSELRSATNPDGTVNISALVSLPLLSSMYMEILRLYSDTLVTRDLLSNLSLPCGSHHYALKKGNMVMAPTYLTHHDQAFWESFNPDHAPASEFDPERFLRTDEAGNVVFSTVGTTGQLFPYGGGAHMCPGRVFAKQEILGAVATLLLEFEFDVDDAQRIPGLRKDYPGMVVGLADGDMTVKLKKRSSLNG